MTANGNEASYLAQLESSISSLQRMVADAKQELEQSQADRAQDARSGALGKDWQAIQARIDSGETTLADVFTGRDGSPEAGRLVQLSRDNLATLAEESEQPEELKEELAAQEEHWARVTRTPRRLSSTEDVDNADEDA
jgi:hypothetical protein